MSKLAMVILNYNDYKTTYDYIKHIECFGNINRIVVVDNCSTDGSYKKLKDLCNNRVNIIQTSSNGGYAKGNNAGLRLLLNDTERIDYVIISNPDILVDESTIEELLTAIESKSDCFAITGEVYTVTGKRIAGFRSKLPTLCQLFVESSVLLRKSLWILFKYGRLYKDDSTETDGNLYKAESLPGCFFLASFEKFLEIGLFDEQTFLYSEEDILFSKAKSAGYKCYVVPNTRIVHAEGTTIKKNLSGWKARERIREQSIGIYMQTCLNVSHWEITAYRIWNRLFSIGRYLNMRIRTKYN